MKNKDVLVAALNGAIDDGGDGVPCLPVCR